MGQFKALMSKNLILYKRNTLGSVLELFLPILFALFVLLVRRLATIDTYDEQQFLNNQTYTFTNYGNPIVAKTLLGVQLPAILKSCNSSYAIALAPAGDPMVTTLNTMFTQAGYVVKQYASDSQIDTIVRDQGYGTTYTYFCFGVSFQNSGADYKYNLRFNISNGQGSQAPSPTTDLTTKSKLNLRLYASSVKSGLIGLTNLINNLILQTQTSSNTNMLVNKQGPIYQEQFINDPIYGYLSNSQEFLFLLPLLIVYLRQTSSMLQQKEKKIRETMSITGMKLWIYYLTWFIRYFIVYLVIHLIVSAIISGTFKHVPYYIPLVVFILFDILLIIQSFFIQIFVTRAKIGIVVALVFFILQYVINFIIANNSNPTQNIYRAVSIVPHVAFILAFKEMLYAQSIQATVTFTTYLNMYTIITAIACILINIIFWGALTWYLDQVFPNEWGAKKHPCFCCVSSHRQQNQTQSFQQLNKSTIQMKPIQLNLQTNEKIKIIDPEVESVQGKYKEMEKNNKALRIRNLNKTFDDFKAVKDLSMNMYTDQIFVLLGHNGAGKTTTISMLTGMVEPTSGLIQVLGDTQLDKIRSKIGVCPQHDTLYEDLTVEQHIRLFATFRGLEGDQLETQVDKLVKDVNLEEKRNQYSKNLSGGQKRRLSVAMAFSGGAKVIILDEPTSGMDTSARRYIWEMLKNYKNDRIILLTTHFMDEADYLGDRIAIMAGGKLVALGSNVYLKNKFGVGYNITFVKKSIDVSSQKIVSCVTKYVLNATVLSDVSSEIVIQLPMDKINFFPQLFSEIDSKKQELGYETYGISITTLQEVFLKVGEEQEQLENNQSSILNSPQKVMKSQIQQIRLQNPKNKIVPHPYPIKQNDSIVQQEQNLERQDGCCERFFSHLGTTILKRLRVIKRDIKSFIFELVLPMIIIILALMLMRVSFISDAASQQFSFKTYLKQGSPIYVPISASAADASLLNSLQNQMTSARNYLSIQQYSATSDLSFDKDFLFPKKLALQSLKGGIYFYPSAVQSGITKIPFTTIINTRSPTSVVALQTLAAEAYINYLGPRTITITPVSKPLPKTFNQLQINNTISGFFAAMIFSVAMSFKFASIVAFIVKQREDKSKHQQIVSGMNIASYWIGNYIYDFLLYLFISIFALVMCQVLKIEALTQGNAFTAICLLFLFYGLSNIPLTYILGYLFKDYGNAQGAIYFFNFVSGGILTLIVLVLRWISTSNQVGKGLAWPLRIIPAFSFGEGLVNIGSISLLSVVQNSGVDQDVFSSQIALAPIIYLATFTCLYIFLMFALQWLQNNEKFMRCFTSENTYDQTKSIQDDDVLKQQKKALQANPTDYQILTKSLRKVYPLDSDKKFKVAVDNLSFGVSKGEVFGLLGVNGAGKTTTFKMLAGQIVSTSGQSFFTGLKISENLSEIRKSLGYCPQFDALIENLTVKEQLELFYDMKCLPKKNKEKAIQRKIKQMNLEEYVDKLSGTLSGGNKRKLSVAMAMIGNPSIIFLDEPSTGMDPKARRFMWKVISRITTERKLSTVILTTHSMEQAEALSTRLGIMVNGNFKCIGTPQHIKSKFGKGFEIEIKVRNVKKEEIEKVRSQLKITGTTISKSQLNEFLQMMKASDNTIKQISKTGSGSYIWLQLEAGKKASANSIIQFHIVQARVQNIAKVLKQALSEAEIIEHFQTFVRFKTGNTVSVGKMFSLLESKKSELYIMQYSIKQATVQQIFNKFAEEQGGIQMD